MNPKWIKLAGSLLKEASEEFSNRCCDDFDWPEDWTEEEIQEFVKKMHEDNGDPHNYDPRELDKPDWWVMSFLGNIMLKNNE